MLKLKRIVPQFFFNNKLGLFISGFNFKKRFTTSDVYWEDRYAANGTSGIGSYGELANYKAGILNKFVEENNIAKVIDFGCGDGNQLKQFKLPVYIGLDVSITALQKCITLFNDDHTKSFFLYNSKEFIDHSQIFNADLSISLDVIYHLIEDDIFDTYMHRLFSVSSRFVIIYAWNIEGIRKKHVKHREFTAWIEKNEKNWMLKQVIKNKDLDGACDFFIFEKETGVSK